MIEYFYETAFELNDKTKFSEWLSRIIHLECKKLGDLAFIFCDDSYLLKMNQQYLRHDTFTDIISFDYSDGVYISGDIFISVERLKDNAKTYRVTLDEEVLRVMAHGVLHCMGYNDKSDLEIKVMREKEDQMIKLFHVEQ